MNLFEACRTFGSLLGSLDHPKKLKSVAKLAVSYVDLVGEFTDTFQEKLQEVAPEQRGIMMYAVDAICLPKLTEECKEYKATFQPLLLEFAKLSAETPESARMCNRVIGWWRKRNFFPTELIDELQTAVGLEKDTSDSTSSWYDLFNKPENENDQIIEPLTQADEQTIKPASPKPVREREFDIKEQDRRAIFSFMDEFHQTQKRRRLDSCLRPENEEDEDEFNDYYFGALRDHLGGKADQVIRNILRETKRASSMDVTPGNASSHPKKVFIWDLDETLIIFQSLLPEKGYRPGVKLENAALEHQNFTLYQMENLVYDVCDDYLSYRKVEDIPVTNITDTQKEGKASVKLEDIPRLKSSDPNYASYLSSIYGVVKRVFENYRSVIPEKLTREAEKHRSAIDKITDGWIRKSVRILEKLKEKYECHFVIVSKALLIPTISKLILFGLADYFKIELIYSSASSNKEECFRKILDRFGGSECEFYAIGDGTEEETAAERMKIPFMPIRKGDNLLDVLPWSEREYTDLLERR